MDHAEEMPDERERRKMKDYSTFIRQMGAAGAPAEIKRRLVSWKAVSLNIGVIGASGVGKSSFINAIRRLGPSDPGAARIDMVQATIVPTPYEYPQNPSVKLWDLPGVGTSQFPRSTYLEQIQFQRYDFFIILCCLRFTEHDVWFARQIRQADKCYLFARSKVDMDIQNDREDYPGRHDEEAVLSNIRLYCTAELSREGFADSFVFLICKNPLLFDFPALEEKLITDLP